MKWSQRKSPGKTLWVSEKPLVEKRPAFARIICPSFQTIRFTGEGGSGFFQQGLYEDLANPWRRTSSSRSESRGCLVAAVCWAGGVLGRQSGGKASSWAWPPLGEGSPGSGSSCGSAMSLWRWHKWEELVQPVLLLVPGLWLPRSPRMLTAWSIPPFLNLQSKLPRAAASRKCLMLNHK